MSNMPHCRFENTLHDFNECVEVIGDIVEAAMGGPTNGNDTELSASEFIKAVELVIAAQELVRRFKEVACIEGEDELSDDDIRDLLAGGE
jgi:hypothetical protein